MGNGATSGDPAKGAGTYFDEKTYTVKLTVKDGSQTSTASQTITVYKKPVVDFSALLVKICANSPVSFTSSSSAGDGTISNYAAASNNVIQWTWSPPDYLNCANCPSPVSKPSTHYV